YGVAGSGTVGRRLSSVAVAEDQQSGAGVEGTGDGAVALCALWIDSFFAWQIFGDYFPAGEPSAVASRSKLSPFGRIPLRWRRGRNHSGRNGAAKSGPGRGLHLL